MMEDLEMGHVNKPLYFSPPRGNSDKVHKDFLIGGPVQGPVHGPFSTAKAPSWQMFWLTMW
jgi:hypothetical protein